MPYQLQTSPFIVPTNDGKLIEEHQGLASTGKKEISIARMIIDTPITQITWRNPKNRMSGLKKTPSFTSVSSRKISHSPRVTRNRDNSALLLPRASCKYAPVPARNTKTGAQKCVIQRVKNRAIFVRERSVGSNCSAAL